MPRPNWRETCDTSKRLTDTAESAPVSRFRVPRQPNQFAGPRILLESIPAAYAHGLSLESRTARSATCDRSLRFRQSTHDSPQPAPVPAPESTACNADLPTEQRPAQGPADPGYSGVPCAAGSAARPARPHRLGSLCPTVRRPPFGAHCGSRVRRGRTKTDRAAEHADRRPGGHRRHDPA